MKRPITLLRSGWRVVCMTLVLGGVMLTQAGPTTAPTIKVTPLSAHLTSPVGPVEDTAAFLFDRDTTTETALTGPVTIEAALDVETEIRSLKIYGEGVCTLTVRGLTSSGWQIVAGPSTVTLGGSGHGWLSLPSATHDSTSPGSASNRIAFATVARLRPTFSAICSCVSLN